MNEFSPETILDYPRTFELSRRGQIITLDACQSEVRLIAQDFRISLFLRL